MFLIKSPVDSDSQQSSMLIPWTSFPSWRRHQVQKVGQNDASGTDGTFFRKVRQEEALLYPCHSLGKGPRVTWWYTAPNTFANEPASQLLISNGFKDLTLSQHSGDQCCFLAHKPGSDAVRLSCQGHTALSWRLQNQPHRRMLKTNTLLASSKLISAQEASQRQQATLLTFPCLIYCFGEGSVSAFWKSCS